MDASKYVRRDRLAPEVAPHATSAVGFAFLNAKVNAAVASIRADAWSVGRRCDPPRARVSARCQQTRAERAAGSA